MEFRIIVHSMMCHDTAFIIITTITATIPVSLELKKENISIRLFLFLCFETYIE